MAYEYTVETTFAETDKTLRIANLTQEEAEDLAAALFAGLFNSVYITRSAPETEN